MQTHTREPPHLTGLILCKSAITSVHLSHVAKEFIHFCCNTPGFSHYWLGRGVLVLMNQVSIEDPTNIALKMWSLQEESQVDTKDCLKLLFTNLAFQRSIYVLGLSIWLKDFRILNLSFHKCSVLTMLPDFQGFDYKVPFSRREDECPYKK